jgi:5'-nucleotidase
MRILCDMDNVVADLMEMALEELHFRYEVNKSIDEVTDYKIENCLGKENWDLIQKILQEPGFYSHLPVTPDAYQGLCQLKDLGHEIIFVTATPDNCFTAVHEKITWVRNTLGLNLPVVSVSAGCPKTVVNGDLLIDDCLDNIKDWVESGKKAILFDQPWNTNVEQMIRLWGYSMRGNCYRAVNWEDVVAAVKYYT